MRKNLLALFLTITFILPSAALAQTATKAKSPALQAAQTITADQLSDYLYFVASDEMEGRDTPSRGLDLTAKFMATMLARWGVKPAGDVVKGEKTYFQKMTLRRNGIEPVNTTAEINGQKLVYGTDFIANPSGGAISSLPMVFGGNGWFVKSKNIDPLAGTDVRGKAVVVYSDNLPRGVTYPDLIASGKHGEDWADPATYAKQKGAAALVFIGTPSIINNWERLRRQRERGNLYVENLRDTPGSGNLPTIYLSQKASQALFSGESTDLNKVVEVYTSNAPLTAFNLSPNKTVSMTVAAKPEIATTQNVVAMIEGSDPVLKSEMVAIGAHYDHDGVNPNAPGEDKIWNGADDDGSGTVAVLSIAEALAKSPRKPKRSVLFVWHAGEEKGLWGSEYFAKFPTVDISKVVAQLNIDMIGRSKKEGDTNPANAELTGPNGVYVIGSEMMSSKLGEVTKSINNSYLKLDYNYKYDDPNDKNRFFFRSDHFNYAQKGIPIVFWFSGVHEDYHKPSDHPDKIDYQKMEKITRTIFLTLWEIADLKERPAVDKQLPPELTQR
ncbi:MAG TPA: M20/M25/M40 family metallo-hydrolase [Pyrinomonadaceae bacterium]|nr:M20/M25/M40 family metallo-hydrolase [Pyrinomonadaceae bacterium]